MLLRRSLSLRLARLPAHASLLRPSHVTRAASAIPVLPFSRRAMSSSSSSSSDSSSSSSFESLGLHAELVTALREMGVTQPTGIQRKSIPAILARKDVLCTAQTGTGKTLAYMVPLVEQLRRQELLLSPEDKLKRMTTIARPQVLVVLPSRELALQVGDVAKRLAHSSKFASCTVTSGERKQLQQQSLGRYLDIVIATPGRLAKCIAKGDVFLSRVHTVVLDEADTLLDAKMGFRSELDAVLTPLKNSAAKRNASLQTVLVAATLRAPLDTVVKKKFGELRLVTDANVHQTPSLLSEEFIRTAPEHKQSALREALGMRRFQHAKTIVFCRNAASVRATDHMLREHGFQAQCLHGDMPPPLREASVEAFHNDDKMNILVCTDLAARGLHFDHVKHVIMCDFPQSAVDYVHRAGRAGRAGEQGFVTSLVTKGDMALARTIEDAKKSRKTIRDLRADNGSAVETLEEETRGEEDGEEGEEKEPRARKHKDTRSGHGTKRLKQHKMRTLRR